MGASNREMPAKAAPLRGRRIVVVEDNPIVKMGVEDALRSAGALIARSYDQEIDAAVLDVRLEDGKTSVPIAVNLSARRIPFCSSPPS
jgi:hypothetical protein